MHNNNPFLVVLFVAASFYRGSDAAASFCVGDLTRQPTPSGYPCKNPENVTVDDFVFTEFVKRVNTSNANKASIVRANSTTFPAFPGLNGLGLAVARADIEPGGAIPLHSHPAATEMIYVAEGSITAGFISGASNVVYVKKLNKGEVMVFPRGLFHFQVNTGKEHAVGIASFSDSEPGVQLVSLAIFGNDFPSFLVEKTTSIDEAEVKKLKALLGGSG
ncbi:unnamed protein product [Linum tenue]|uniref:Germin-like protein n=2 Tax=Linum tenue TaxID=586396 RepID=A0AAV0KBN0_9ROSI|nr:unnamed protein product [Linum tenue]